MSSNIPKLRFAEFSEEWKTNSIGQAGVFYNGLTGKTAVDFGSGKPYITYKSIFDNAKVDLRRVEYVNVQDGENQNRVKKGDIFFTTSSEIPNEVGVTSVLLDDIDECYLNSFCFGYRLNDTEKNLPQYFRHYLRSRFFRNKIEILAQGSTRYNISKSEVSKIEYLFPKPKEQKKIADFLSAVDSRIEGLEMIMDLQKRYKQGVMQRIFNQTIRFKDNNGNPFPDWQEVKLGNICEMQSGKFVSASNIHASQTLDMYPCYGGNGLRGYTESFTHDGEFPLIGRQGALCGNITCANGKFHATEHAVVATANSNIDSRWLFYQLIKLNLNKYATGQAQPGLSVEIIKKISTHIPSDYLEQKKIADFLSDLDTKIEATQKQLDAAHEWKKGLFQKMFV